MKEIQEWPYFASAKGKTLFDYLIDLVPVTYFLQRYLSEEIQKIGFFGHFQVFQIFLDYVSEVKF